jgi:hypothetical protein
MNAYTTTGQARIQSHDLAAILRTSTGSYMAAVSLASLERQRGWQKESEVEWQLTQNGIEPHADTSFVSALRQTVGAALIRAGEHLAGVPRRAVSPEMTPATSKLGEAG